MNFEELELEHGVQIAERLAFIDFRLQFTGFLTRSDFTAQFGVASAAASKEITFYRELRPQNVTYDRVFRANLIQVEHFKPLLDMRAETGLGMLANGFNKNMLLHNSFVPYERVGLMKNELDVTRTSAITRALNIRCATKCRYLSANSGTHSDRTLFPTALFYDGLSWMFRAYDEKDGHFKCFNFSRATHAETAFLTKSASKHQLAADKEWHLTIPLELSIHPGLSRKKKEALKVDFNFPSIEEKIITTEKAPLVYFLINNWKIDAGEEPAENNLYNFYLENREMLRAFDSTKKIIETRK